MERAGSRPAKIRAAVIFSVVAVMVILGIAWIVTTRSPVTPPPGASGTPVSNPSVSGRATFQKVPNQVLFALDDSGNPDLSGDLTNIKQGDAGDCYFLAALMTVASRAPATVLNMVHDNGNGAHTISFHSKYDGVSNPVTVTVNGDLPYRRGKPSNSDGELVSDHSYALLGLNPSDQTVVVGDPEGGHTTLAFATFQSTNINQYIAIPTYP